MNHRVRLLLCLVLSLVLVGLLLTSDKNQSALANKDDCQDCLSDCNNERQFCLRTATRLSHVWLHGGHV